MLATLKNEQTQNFLYESRRRSWEIARTEPNIETSYQEGRLIILQDQNKAQEDHESQATQQKNKDKDYLQIEHASAIKPIPELRILKANATVAI